MILEGIIINRKESVEWSKAVDTESEFVNFEAIYISSTVENKLVLIFKKKLKSYINN